MSAPYNLITPERMVQTINAIDPHEPKGVQLLREATTTGAAVFPTHIPREQFIEATQQAVKEHDAIDKLIGRLNDLPPVAANTSFGDVV